MKRVLVAVGRFAARHPWRVIAAWALVAVAVVAAGVGAGGSFNNAASIPGSQSARATSELKADFPARSGATQQVVFHAERGVLTAAADQDAISASMHAAAALPGVSSVVSPGSGGPVSTDADTALATVLYAKTATSLHESDFTALQNAMAPAVHAGLEVEYGGDLVSSVERPSTGNSDKIGLLVALVVLVVAFGSVVAAGVPIGTAVIGLAIGLSVVKLLSAAIAVPSTTTTLATMIGLGVGIDYALFLVTRFREELAGGRDPVDAAGVANSTAGASVLFAGTTVVIAILGLAIAGIPFVTNLGLGTAAAVVVAVAVALTLLPALCGLAGWHINALNLTRHQHQARHEETTGFWARWAEHVAEHPLAYFAVTLLVLVTIASPLVSMRLGQTDAGTLPTSSTQRRAYDLIARAFGPGYNGPLKVAVDLPAGTPGSLPAHVAAAIKTDRGVAAVSAPQLSASGTTAVLTAIPTTSPESAATAATVQGLRDHILPAATAGTGATALVTGSTAGNIDLAHRVASRLALFIAAVVALSFVLLMMVFRSVWVPLKAAVMNGLSVGAGYGIVVAVFQWGWLKSVVGLRHTVPIESWVPMMMFAILFGLSMDYEVFLLSRVRERWEQTGDSRQSVVDGIARTGRVITSAALIMVSVFASFVLIDDPVVKMIGVGLAASVLVDATIIRMVLVPATMEMLGDANWWLPAWLDRLLPSIDLESSAPIPVPTAKPAPA